MPNIILTLEEQVFPGDSDMARLMRATNWAETPLGPVQAWPQSLRTSISICLTSRFPILLWWGPELVMLYNDAYRPMLGNKHPASLGAAGKQVWSEIWHIIGPMLAGVLRDGVATWSDDQFLPLERNGYSEECYFTFSYSPIQDESGSVGGVFCAVTETTVRVLAERRARLARDLAAVVVDARTTDEVYLGAIKALAADVGDLPFALLYELQKNGAQARLMGSIGLGPKHPLAAPLIHLADAPPNENGFAPLVRHVAHAGRSALEPLPEARWDDAPEEAGEEHSPRCAYILPITEPGKSEASAVLVAGVSPQRVFDDAYEGFFELLASHLASGLASAHAHEAERQRAEELAAIDRAKTAFFSNVSHEFRTPLTLMLGPLTELLSREEGLATEARQEIEMARRNGLRLTKLVNTLLDFSRIEAGRAEARYLPTDLAALTTDLASAFRSLMEKAGLTFTVDCPPLPEPVAVDRDMWEKIVLNLLSNAFKFTFTGSVTVRLRAEDGAAVLRVSDTGSGIPASELPRLFERFHRIEGVRARTHEGSGIGLALVQELAHLQGGAITAESVEGLGTTFTVRIPFRQRHLSDAEHPTPASHASTALGVSPFLEEAERWLPGGAQSARAASGDMDDHHATHAASQGARVLVVDDNADMREYLARLLRERYTVTTAPNGAAALDAIRASLPDLVITDVMMPELDGFALLERLRADARTAALPVMLLSARAGEEATIEGLARGADDYLVKPFSAREVLSRVATRLEIARARQENEGRTRAALDAMMELAEVMATATEEPEAQARLAELLASMARDVLGCEIVSLMRVDPTEKLTPLATVGREPALTVAWWREIGDFNLADYYTPTEYQHLLTGEPVVVNVRANLSRGLNAYGTQTTLTVAMRHSGQMIGILSCAYTREHTYTATERELAYGFGQLAAIMLDRARLTQERAQAQAQALALQEATRRMDEFLSVASHELRTPLTSISANVQMSERFADGLEKATLPESQQKRALKLHHMLERSGRQLQRLDRLVGDLLDVSRISAGKLELRQEPCDLNVIVQDAIEAQRAGWPDRVITRELPRRQLPLILADADRIGQVVTNYLTNALKYAPPEKPITLTVRAAEDAIRVAVRDHGPGLDRAQQARLFERFYRVPGIGQQSGSVMGLGLGLYICKTIIERHGGALGVESAPGEGATFWFTLPLPRHPS